MNSENEVIENLDDLEAFLLSVENGGLGLEGVAGVGMATNNSDGRHFVAVFNEKQQLLLARWITDNVFETGKDLVRNGPKRR
ncbi:hypothetical protein BCU70_03090 [Vibrio sp. 10N.286.49.C2]|uniref:hypothetical protein n=1 Tax=unclassified Vibrio TaxID=2614977 RepID=UPI000C856C9D|nr:MULTISPECIES: hypothetical protein [unclassified Vibrio]PMH38273.1 hypothetical protein BCU70_03090 [Vibrio sp. 10N.286.49.C2]PMH55681.1 hypothetical protein BCU66_08685 [Vibrio sp. 10N.286.49.B1]PMH79259.1 hypothetical protein BCU58_05845 [Vibrio sp. 10N.286.48.B7]